MNISELSKSEQNYNFTKITGNRDKTKYEISANNEHYTIKIIGYRYNDKTNGNYAYVHKHIFNLEEYDFLFFVLHTCNKSHLLKIPPYVFKNPAPNSAFKNRDYIGKKSLPEYGILINKNTLNELLMYEECLLQ